MDPQETEMELEENEPQEVNFTSEEGFEEEKDFPNPIPLTRQHAMASYSPSEYTRFQENPPSRKRRPEYDDSTSYNEETYHRDTRPVVKFKNGYGLPDRNTGQSYREDFIWL